MTPNAVMEKPSPLHSLSAIVAAIATNAHFKQFCATASQSTCKRKSQQNVDIAEHRDTQECGHKDPFRLELLHIVIAFHLPTENMDAHRTFTMAMADAGDLATMIEAAIDDTDRRHPGSKSFMKGTRGEEPRP
jgi:hypothetical protein